MERRTSAWFRLLLWIAFLVAGLAGLHNLGDSFPVSAITDAGGPAEPALAAALRLIGLAAGYWLAGSSILYLLARASRLPTAIRAVSWMTVGPIRRLVDRVAAGALAITLTIPIAASAVTSPGYVPVPAGDSAEQSSSSIVEETTTTTTSGSRPPTAVENIQTPVTANPLYLPVQAVVDAEPVLIAKTVGQGEASEVVVRSGDNMWKLAEDRLTTILGRAATDAEIAPYWLQIIAANSGRIRSGDPDLIFPGEVLVLPSITPSP